MDDIYVHMITSAQLPPAREDVFSGSGIAMVLPRGSSNLMAGLAGRPQVRSLCRGNRAGGGQLGALRRAFRLRQTADLFSLQTPASVLHSIRRRRDLASGTL
ncbi:hypothetical protein JR065_07205 [Xanthomonas sp. AmX2]|uniref:hypothetical protein n=1 Tax=Xanthomonas sp. TaxID=29446 RepID=UPI00197F30FB|nr:hypothetical protein [Xanthomonas sp.]MBN6150123.1 hypothetical protein [Xanthomonas sp.]